MYFDNAASSRRTDLFIEEHLQALGKFRTPKEEVDILDRLSRKVASLFNADYETISFVPNATYALNEIALFFAESELDYRYRKIYLSTAEHLSNHLVWLNPSFIAGVHYFDLDKLSQLNPVDPSIISFSAMSNLEGIMPNWNDIERLASSGHEVIVDASQFMQHKLVNLSESEISYLVFSAHKFYGPNGIGVIYDKERNNLGLSASNYFCKADCYCLDFDALEAWCNSIDEIIGIFNDGSLNRTEEKLNSYFLDNFPINDYVELVNSDTSSCIFLLKIIDDDMSAQDYVFYLAKNNVIVRSGLSCSWLSSERLDSSKVFRVSLNFFNTIEEIDFFFNLIRKFEILDCL